MISKGFLLVCLAFYKYLKSVEKIVALKVRLIEEREAEKICLFYSVSLLFSAESAGAWNMRRRGDK